MPTRPWSTPSQLTPLPSTFDYAEGATFLAGHGTAYHALIDRGQLQPGEVLLVHGAGGGVGLAAVEIGKMLGATVIAAASSATKSSRSRKRRGADHLVLYDREPFRDAVKRITDGRGADVVFDPVGGEMFENTMRCIAWGARLLVIGFTGGIGLARTNLLLIKGASVLGVRAGEAVRKNPALGEVRIKALTEWAEAGKIRPNISHRLPLEDFAKAMRLLIDRKAIGRVALMMRVRLLVSAGKGGASSTHGIRCDRDAGHAGSPAFADDASVASVLTYTPAPPTTGNSRACRSRPCS